MRILSATVGALLLLALLTWFQLRGVETDRSARMATARNFDDFALSQASLQRDVLRARAGLLRNYDKLDQALQAMQAAVAHLRASAADAAIDPAPTERLAKALASQSSVVERFKTINAPVQNSLNYVGMLSTAGGFGADAPGDPQTGAQLAAAGRLAADILQLTRDTAPASVAALQERIDWFAAQDGTGGEAAHALLSHAGLLRDLLPQIDEALKMMMADPTRAPLEAARLGFAEHYAALDARSEQFRLLLYMTSILLVIALLLLGHRLRLRARALRERAAFEHIVAENSTRLINCPPVETAARLSQVLGEVCGALGAQRGYVLFRSAPSRIYRWSAPDAAFPPGWPDGAPALCPPDSDTIAVPSVAALPAGARKDALQAAGLTGWACVPLHSPELGAGIMGFDALRPGWSAGFPVPVIRLAGDAVVHALERGVHEAERARLATRLERARRLQTIGAWASGIAHNFNNVIGAILGYSEMLAPALMTGGRPAEQLDEIKRAAERARDLVDNILTFGRRREARLRLVPVDLLLDEAAALLRASLPARIALDFDPVPTGLAIRGEPAQLQQIILNLCSNAAEAITADGRIEVGAAAAEVTATKPLSHGLLEPGRYIRLTVVDTGRGFNESVARRLFEPFFTTRATGTGLGLATVREIVADHGGAIDVASTPGRGSRFEAWLPSAMPGAAADARRDSRMIDEPLQGQGEAVLIVEEDKERLLHCEEMLAALGYEPVGFARAAEATAALRAAPGRFDAILLSHASASPAALDLARRLREIAPRLPVLLAAGTALDISIDLLAGAGISEVLGRPLIGAELADALARALCAAPSLRS